MKAEELHAWTVRYRKSPEPVRAIEAFQQLESVAAFRPENPARGAAAGLVLSLWERHPEMHETWSGYDDLHKKANKILVDLCRQDAPGVSDYLVVRWFILGDRQAVQELVQRSQREDAVGRSTVWALTSLCANDPDLLALVKALSRDKGIARA